MRWLALSMPFAVASCALFLDTGGLSGAGEPTNDAGDAGSTGTDGGGGGDATTAGAESDADGTAPTGTCGADLTDNFDDGDLGAKWDSVTQSNATLALDNMGPLSAPNALLVTITGIANPHATLTKRFTQTKRICCEMAVRGFLSETTLVRFNGRGGNYVVSLRTGSGSAVLAESLYNGDGSPDNYSGTVGSFSPWGDTWQRLRIDLVLGAGASKGTARVSVNGALATSASIGSNTVDLEFNEVVLGIPYAQTGSGTTRFDDVACSFK